MKPIKTRPVLAMNFYQKTSHKEADKLNPGPNNFGYLPYTSMIKKAQKQRTKKHIQKKQQQTLTLTNIEQIVQNLLPIESKINISNTLEQQAHNQQNINNNKPGVRYHADPEYFRDIRKKLKSINSLIDRLGENQMNNEYDE